MNFSRLDILQILIIYRIYSLGPNIETHELPYELLSQPNCICQRTQTLYALQINISPFECYIKDTKEFHVLR